MSDLMKQVKQLRITIFNMLNYANMYVLILDEELNIKFANDSLAKDLGFNSYKEIVEKCWLNFIKSEEIEIIKTIHKIISTGKGQWEKYREFQNIIIGKNKNEINVNWFNDHINHEYNWTFSFGIRKNPQTNITMDSIRDYYKDIIERDRTMINSMKDMILLKDNIDSCVPH